MGGGGGGVDSRRKSHTVIMRHQEDNQRKATSSLFPIKLIAKLERAQRNAQQNIKQLPDPTKGETNKQGINNNITTALEEHQPEPMGWGCLYKHKHGNIAWRLQAANTTVTSHKLYIIVEDPIVAAELLNADLEMLAEWALKWLVKFNPLKLNLF